MTQQLCSKKIHKTFSIEIGSKKDIINSNRTNIIKLSLKFIQKLKKH